MPVGVEAIVHADLSADQRIGVIEIRRHEAGGILRQKVRVVALPSRATNELPAAAHVNGVEEVRRGGVGVAVRERAGLRRGVSRHRIVGIGMKHVGRRSCAHADDCRRVLRFVRELDAEAGGVTERSRWKTARSCSSGSMRSCSRECCPDARWRPGSWWSRRPPGSESC